MKIKTIHIILASLAISSVEGTNLDLPYPIMRISRTLKPFVDGASALKNRISEEVFKLTNQNIEPIISFLSGEELKARYSRHNLILELEGAELAISKDRLPTNAENPSENIYFKDEILRLVYNSIHSFKLIRSSPIRQFKAILDTEEGNYIERGLFGAISKIDFHYPDYLPIDMPNYADFKNSLEIYLSRHGLNPESLVRLSLKNRGFTFMGDKFIIGDTPLTNGFDFQKETEDGKHIKFRLSNKDLGEFYLTIKRESYSKTLGRNYYEYDFESKNSATGENTLEICCQNCIDLNPDGTTADRYDLLEIKSII